MSSQNIENYKSRRIIQMKLDYSNIIQIIVITVKQIKMSDSDEQVSISAMKQLQKAQKKLDDVENNMKRYRSKRKEQVQVNKAPSPDLSKYFSFLGKDILQQDENQYSESNYEPKVKPEVFTHTFQKHSQMDKENNSLSINQKLQVSKNSSIDKIEEYYLQRNTFLQQKIDELKQNKQKIVGDQKLLRRENQELQDKIQKQRQNKRQPNKSNELKIMIEEMKRKIEEDDAQQVQTMKKREQIKKQLKQCLKNHKKNISQSLQPFK